jgi:hypothetical protein
VILWARVWLAGFAAWCSVMFSVAYFLGPFAGKSPAYPWLFVSASLYFSRLSSKAADNAAARAVSPVPYADRRWFG